MFADVVTDWNAVMLTAVRSQGAHVQSRIAAVTHLAMHDAVNSITNEYQTYALKTAMPAQASADAAAITSAYRVLITYAPASASVLDAERTRTLAAIPDGMAKLMGMQVGEAAAQAVLALRANDGSSTPVPYTPSQGIGYWQPTPPAFSPAVAVNWGRVLPFALEKADQFRPDPPPSLTSNTYRRDYAEVREIGAAQAPTRPQDRTDLARYMSMTSPTQIWNPVADQLSSTQRLTLSGRARMFALMNMAVADAAIALFEAKYHYNYWRPVTAIRAGDLDENPRTEGDPNFTSLITAPAYPSYPSGFGALSNAASSVLERLFGRGPQRFTLTPNPALPNMNLNYTRLRQLTDDIDDARVYGGIHFRFEQEAAEVLGQRVARYVTKHQLRPVVDSAE
jgi:hypothetical protein